jgi:hypothetical protein
MSMYEDLYTEFLESDDTLRVYEGDTPVFTSKKGGLRPPVEYIAATASRQQPVTIFDKIMGNAAALLAAMVNCREVYSPLGSELAVRTLDRFGITYHIDKIVPYIQQPDGISMCPMEKLSIGKEPEEFYQELKIRLAKAS